MASNKKLSCFISPLFCLKKKELMRARDDYFLLPLRIKKSLQLRPSLRRAAVDPNKERVSLRLNSCGRSTPGGIQGQSHRSSSQPLFRVNKVTLSLKQ